MVGPVQYVCSQSKRTLLAIAVPIGTTEYILACFPFHPMTVVKPRGKMAEAFKVLPRRAANEIAASCLPNDGTSVTIVTVQTT